MPAPWNSKCGHVKAMVTIDGDTLTIIEYQADPQHQGHGPRVLREELRPQYKRIVARMADTNGLTFWPKMGARGLIDEAYAFDDDKQIWPIQDA